MLWMYQRVFYGKVTVPVNNTLPDATLRERLALWPTVVFALIMGVASPLWMGIIDPSVKAAIGSANYSAQSGIPAESGKTQVVPYAQSRQAALENETISLEVSSR